MIRDAWLFPGAEAGPALIFGRGAEWGALRRLPDKGAHKSTRGNESGAPSAKGRRNLYRLPQVKDPRMKCQEKVQIQKKKERPDVIVYVTVPVFFPWALETNVLQIYSTASPSFRSFAVVHLTICVFASSFAFWPRRRRLTAVLQAGRLFEP